MTETISEQNVNYQKGSFLYIYNVIQLSFIYYLLLIWTVLEITQPDSTQQLTVQAQSTWESHQLTDPLTPRVRRVMGPQVGLIDTADSLS